MNFFEAVDERRARAATKLQNADLEKALFFKYFPSWLNFPRPQSRKQTAMMVHELNKRQNWVAYNLHVRSLVKNFAQRQSLRSQSISWLLNAKPWDLQPQVWENYQQEVYDWKWEDNVEEEANNNGGAAEGSFKCAKCGSYRVTYTQMQTRSADEGMTSLFHCLNCQKRWKVY